MGEALRRLGGRIAGGMFGLGLMVGGVLGAWAGSRPENQQEPWQKRLHELARYLDLLGDPEQKPNPPDGCQGARVRLLNARNADGAPAYVLSRLERRMTELC